MSNNNVSDRRLQILQEFFGFLAIILALIIPIFWDEFQELEDIQAQILYILFIEILILGLVLICAFYFARYSGKDLLAEFIGTILFIILAISIFILTSPFLETIRGEIINLSNLAPQNFIITVFSVISLIVLWLIGAGIAIFEIGRILLMIIEKIRI